MSELLLTHLALAALTAALGYLAGYRAARHAREDTPMTPVDPVDDPEDAQVPVRRPRRYVVDRTAAGYVVGALALILAALTAFQQADADRDRTRCLNTYANTLADALDARTEATDRRVLALDDVLTVTGELLAGRASQLQLQTALNRYNAAAAELIEQRERNPYPPAPRAVCD